MPSFQEYAAAAAQKRLREAIESRDPVALAAAIKGAEHAQKLTENSRERALEAKDAGNKAFQEKSYAKALKFYSEAIEHDPTDAVFFSNRSGAYASLLRHTEALADAEECVRLRPDWWKAYSRKGTAEFHLERLADSERSFVKGLGLLPDEPSLEQGLAQVRTKKAMMSGRRGRY
mmetsp:Transcript_70392/g.124746  ORF Transcript_70392/g.124746 Transcript_70392/m.124746 type:complete len:175 (+) Transcript_70392:3-527(+)